ncbi:hypothetical protein T07_2767 [Trichinella nelsoni]|uniref:Uncharacterized protein n=1 Tax=Trichinella nelsoni TaxID=6336 RepID=A0A0V0SP75_9BILA|nr:hypothetical protein T07_2767 [Trichinella nelsoni]
MEQGWLNFGIGNIFSIIMSYSFTLCTVFQYFVVLGNSIFLHFRSILNKLKKQSEETVDHVSLYLTPLAFGAPTGTPSTISSHYKIEKQDRARRNKMGMHKVRIVSLSRKGVSKQDGIVEVPEETLTATTISRSRRLERTGKKRHPLASSGKDFEAKELEEKKTEDMDRKAWHEETAVE